MAHMTLCSCPGADAAHIVCYMPHIPALSDDAWGDASTTTAAGWRLFGLDPLPAPMPALPPFINLPAPVHVLGLRLDAATYGEAWGTPCDVWITGYDDRSFPPACASLRMWM